LDCFAAYSANENCGIRGALYFLNKQQHTPCCVAYSAASK